MRTADLLRALGKRVRALRDEKGLSRRALSERSRLSERFLAQVEQGEGNPSLATLAQIADALDTSPPELLASAVRKKAIVLLGLRGAGKSSIGEALAKRLRVPFVELDQRIEEAAGLSLPEIFVLHGEEYYRRLEREVIEALFREDQRCVCAASGGVVTNDEAFETLRRNAVTVWLRARPEEHWDRVLAQGDHRPMANDPLAMQRLRELLAEREPLYARADLQWDTSQHSIEETVEKLAKAVRA
jgi:XRE family transcriptional regulator, aerobic/anaerobic benzoate catabolism transcriptional regulator